MADLEPITLIPTFLKTIAGKINAALKVVKALKNMEVKPNAFPAGLVVGNGNAVLSLGGTGGGKTLDIYISVSGLVKKCKVNGEMLP